MIGDCVFRQCWNHLYSYFLIRKSLLNRYSREPIKRTAPIIPYDWTLLSYVAPIILDGVPGLENIGKLNQTIIRVFDFSFVAFCTHFCPYLITSNLCMYFAFLWGTYHPRDASQRHREAVDVAFQDVGQHATPMGILVHAAPMGSIYNADGTYTAGGF